jgi:hypothetical protein
MGTSGGPRPFTIHVPEDVLQDLRERLARTRWPDEGPRFGLALRHQPRLSPRPVPVLAGALRIEKLQRWTDCDGDVEKSVSRDEILTDVMIYWITDSINASFWPYYDRLHQGRPLPEERIDVPTGYAEFPREILHIGPPLS